jgi:hypothetical protein
MLKQINDALFNEHKKLLDNYVTSQYPIYFIIAQPRGASSLLQQLLMSNLKVGYISNFLAKFYKVPIFGMELEKDIFDAKYKSNFLSNYGNTLGFHEPHEWGWFWKEVLHLKGESYYSDDIDFEAVSKNLNAITSIKKLPLIIDNVYAMANLIKLKKELKNIKIINLTRDLYFISNSIINARISRYNDINQFYGHTPRNIDEILKIKNPIEQIVYQVKSIQNEIDEIVGCFASQDVLHVDYEEIYEDSDCVVSKFFEFVRKDGFILEKKEKHLPILSYRNDESLIKKEYKDELDFYYKKYFKEC